MGLLAVRTLKSIVVPLLVRAVGTGALAGACISAGIAAISTIQAALYPEQFGLWGMHAGQIFFMAMIGLVVGAVAGVATWAGSVAALWIEVAMAASIVLPRARTAGLGAGAMTMGYAVVVPYALGMTGVAMVAIGAGLGTVSGLLAAFYARQLVSGTRRSSADPGAGKK